jgi:hypothetical protein
MAITSFRAGEAISAGQAIYVSSVGLIFKASSLTQDQASVAGIAIDSGVTGDLIRVNSDAIYNSYSGLTPGNIRYLSATTSGLLVSYTVWASGYNLTSSGCYLEPVGRAITSSGLAIEIGKPQFIVK